MNVRTITEPFVRSRYVPVPEVISPVQKCIWIRLVVMETVPHWALSVLFSLALARAVQNYYPYR